MSEIWFRGEGVDVAPARPGSTAPHDLGDGMYLTDNQKSAKAYAELRTTDPTRQRIYSVRIDPSSMRILDLTRDPRWAQFVKPVEQLLKTGNVNENYGRTFRNFLSHFKIDIARYDAVIGPDYVRGGRQMCVLHVNGKPSRIHVAIRKLFKPVVSRTGAPPVATRNWVPKINIHSRGFRIAGGIGVTIIASLIGGWLQARWEKGKIEEGTAEVDRQIKDDLGKRTAEIAWLQLRLDPGERVYANATVEVHFGRPRWDPTGRGRFKYPLNDAPTVWLTSLEITTRNIKREETEKMFNARIERLVTSFEVEVYTAEELTLYRDLATDYMDYLRRIGMDPSNQVFAEEARRLKDQIATAFGSDAPVLQTAKAMLPKELQV